jgi:hypothetical protein
LIFVQLVKTPQGARKKSRKVAAEGLEGYDDPDQNHKNYCQANDDLAVRELYSTISS